MPHRLRGLIDGLRCLPRLGLHLLECAGELARSLVACQAHGDTQPLDRWNEPADCLLSPCGHCDPQRINHPGESAGLEGRRVPLQTEFFCDLCRVPGWTQRSSEDRLQAGH